MNVVTSRGQVTIPKAVRDQLGIEPGNVVDFDLALDGRVVLVKRNGKPPRNRFASLRGIAGAGLTTDEIMAMTRAEG